MKGIDVSKWQGTIDWQKVKQAGIKFVMIREGYGKDGKDKKFEDNYSGAKKAGIPVGVYHYSYADSVEDAKKEAEFCLKNINGKQFEYPICFDIEDKEQLKLNNRQRTDIVKAFCGEIEKAGYYAMFYCNLNWINNYLCKSELLEKYDFWLAQWGTSRPSINCGIWQNSDTGKIDGISGNCDLDIAYKDYPEIMKTKGLNGYGKNSEYYTIKKGDTLSGLAKQYNTTVDKLAKLNNIKDIDKIYVGDKIRLS